MKQDNFIFWTYIISWVIYYSQESFGLEGIASFLLVFLLPFSFYCFCIEFNKNKNRNGFLKSLGFLALLYLSYGVLHMIFGTAYYTVSTFYYFKFYANSILPIFAYYFLLRKVSIGEKQLIVLIGVFLLVAYIDYETGERNALEASGREEVTNNGTYRFLPLLSLIFLIKNDIVKYFVLVVSLLFIVLGMKRGPILIGACISFVFILNSMSTEKSFKKKFVGFLFLAASMFFIYKQVITLMDNSLYFQMRVDQTLEGDSSGRDVIMSSFFRRWMDQSNIFNFLFGYGADGTLRLFGIYAHNDWLETMINQGFIGIFIYFWYVLSFYKQWKSMKKSERMLYLCFGTLLLNCFLTSLFSMSINNMRVALQFAIAYCLSEFDKLKINKLALKIK